MKVNPRNICPLSCLRQGHCQSFQSPSPQLQSEAKNINITLIGIVFVWEKRNKGKKVNKEKRKYIFGNYYALLDWGEGGIMTPKYLMWGGSED